MTIEENVLSGGFGEQVLHYVSRAKLDVGVRCIGIPDDYVEHGNVDLLRRESRTGCGDDCKTDYCRLCDDRKRLT